MLLAQPGRAGLPLQQEGFKPSIAGRCLGVWWDSRGSRSVHMCSHASVQHWLPAEVLWGCCLCCRDKKLAVRSDGIRVGAGLKSASALVWRGAGCAHTSLGRFAGGHDPRCEWQCWTGRWDLVPVGLPPRKSLHPALGESFPWPLLEAPET